MSKIRFWGTTPAQVVHAFRISFYIINCVPFCFPENSAKQALFIALVLVKSNFSLLRLVCSLTIASPPLRTKTPSHVSASLNCFLNDR